MSGANGKGTAVPARGHLSYSRVQKYLTCPEQYRLHYVEGLRPKAESASLVFGSIVHLAIADFFRRKIDPSVTFAREWQAIQPLTLRYSGRDTWESLRGKGVGLLGKFPNAVAAKIQSVVAVEEPFQLGLTTLDLPFIGIIDLVAQIDGKRTVVEFKTAASDFEAHEIELLDQLSAYQLARPEAEQIGVCVLVKTKEPKIVWHYTQRSPDQVVEYAEKTELVASHIQQQIFYKRPGKWCRQCEFVPVCTRDQVKAEETLVRIQYFFEPALPGSFSICAYMFSWRVPQRWLFRIVKAADWRDARY